MQNQYVKSIKLKILRSDGIIKLKFKIDKEAFNQIEQILQAYEGDILELVRLEVNGDKNSFTIILKPTSHLFDAIADQLKNILQVGS